VNSNSDLNSFGLSLFELDLERRRIEIEIEIERKTRTQPKPKTQLNPRYRPKPQPGPSFPAAQPSHSRAASPHAKPSTLSRSPANPDSTRSLSHRCPGPTCRHCLLPFPSSPRPNCSARWTTTARLPLRCAVARPASQAYRPASPEPHLPF